MIGGALVASDVYSQRSYDAGAVRGSCTKRQEARKLDLLCVAFQLYNGCARLVARAHSEVLGVHRGSDLALRSQLVLHHVKVLLLHADALGQLSITQSEDALQDVVPLLRREGHFGRQLLTSCLEELVGYAPRVAEQALLSEVGEPLLLQQLATDHQSLVPSRMRWYRLRHVGNGVHHLQVQVECLQDGVVELYEQVLVVSVPLVVRLQIAVVFSARVGPRDLGVVESDKGRSLEVLHEEWPA